MYNIKKKIKYLLDENGWTQKKLCGELGKTENGFKSMLDNYTIKLSVLEEIAKIFGVKISFFFEEENSSQKTVTADIASMQMLIEELRRDKQNLQNSNNFLQGLVEKKILFESNSPQLKVANGEELGKHKECSKQAVVTKVVNFLPKENFFDGIILKQG